MLKFKEFLNEEEQLVIDAPTDLAEVRLDDLNDALEAVTADPFVNSAVFMNAVRGTLERFGIILPPNYVTPMLSAEAETVYRLGESGLFVYIAHNLNDGLVEGYAQVVNEEDLEDLQSLRGEPEEDNGEDYDVLKYPQIPADRKKASMDSGNSDEYS